MVVSPLADTWNSLVAGCFLVPVLDPFRNCRCTACSIKLACLPPGLYRQMGDDRLLSCAGLDPSRNCRCTACSIKLACLPPCLYRQMGDDRMEKPMCLEHVGVMLASC